MKARRVKRLDPQDSLADNAERIIRVRVDEVYAFMPRARNPQRVSELHDMRIAAKRLRYVLELCSSYFGSYARTAAKRVKELQDLLGEIHDCDVMRPMVLSHLDHLRERDAAEVRSRAGGSQDLAPALSAHASNRSAYRGLDVLAVHLGARRELLFERFLELWESWDRNDVRGRLERALDERPHERADDQPEPVPAPTPPGEGELPADEGDHAETGTINGAAIQPAGRGGTSDE